MPRVLHIIASRESAGADAEGSDLALLACAAQARIQPDCLIVLLATRAGHQRAASLGLRPHIVIAPPLGREELAAPALSARLRPSSFPAQVVAWGSRTARLARVLGFNPQTSRPDSWQPPTPADASMTARLNIRRALGIDDRAAVFLGIGEPAGRFDAFYATRMLSLLDVAGRSIVCLFPHGAASYDRARRFHRDVGLSMGVLLREEPWWRDASWTDFALLSPRAELRSPRALAVDRACVETLCRAKVPTLLERSLVGALNLADPADPNLIVGRSDGHAALAKRTLQTLLERPSHSELKIARPFTLAPATERRA